MNHCLALMHIRTQHNIRSPLDLWHSPANCLLFFRGAGVLGQTRWGGTTTLSSSLRCELAVEHNTAEQYFKTDRTKLQKDLRRCYRSWNTCQDFLIIPSLGAAALETERRCFSKVILAPKVTPSITRSVDPCGTVPSRVNGDNRGWTVRDLETS